MTVTTTDERLLTPERLAELRVWVERQEQRQYPPRYVGLKPSTAIALIDALEAARKEIAGLREGLHTIASVDDDGYTSDGHERCVETAIRLVGAA